MEKLAQIFAPNFLEKDKNNKQALSPFEKWHLFG